jgi:hypothetical protein
LIQSIMFLYKLILEIGLIAVSALGGPIPFQ